MGWNFGDILYAVEDAVPASKPAIIHDGRSTNWSDYARRTNNLACAITARGAAPGSKVAFYLYNGPAYLEMLGACFKAGLVHVNVNYRYKAEEVRYILDNSDAQTIVYDPAFRPVIEQLKDRLPTARLFLETGHDEEKPAYCESYEALAGDGAGHRPNTVLSPDDFIFIYTGGTTGAPKGVIWRHHDLRSAQLDALRKLGPVPETLEAHGALIRSGEVGGVTLPACPLMHGTGMLTALAEITNGGTVVTLKNRSFDAHELWGAVTAHCVTSISIVGDAFSRPMLAALDEKPGEYDLSSVRSIISSGVMWSADVKQRILERLPQAALLDSFGAAEALGFGASIATAENIGKTAQFTIGDKCRLFDEFGDPIGYGEGRPGLIARGGAIPFGYYKDPEKTAQTFKVIDGERYAIPGDWCLVDASGTMTLLGRGSACINSGGEKIYPEEVEEALKTHECVEDALVVGVPDDNWGQAVTGVVLLRENAQFDEQALREHVRLRLAGYKAPKRIVRSKQELRAPNGKGDYTIAEKYALAALEAY